MSIGCGTAIPEPGNWPTPSAEARDPRLQKPFEGFYNYMIYGIYSLIKGCWSLWEAQPGACDADGAVFCKASEFRVYGLGVLLFRVLGFRGLGLF